MGSAIVAIGIASIFVGAFMSHFLTKRRREAERQEPPIPEFMPGGLEDRIEQVIARRIMSSQIKWEIDQK